MIDLAHQGNLVGRLGPDPLRGDDGQSVWARPVRCSDLSGRVAYACETCQPRWSGPDG